MYVLVCHTTTYKNSMQQFILSWYVGNAGFDWNSCPDQLENNDDIAMNNSEQ